LGQLSAETGVKRCDAEPSYVNQIVFPWFLRDQP
jgi:hypothetical protein